MQFYLFDHGILLVEYMIVRKWALKITKFLNIFEYFSQTDSLFGKSKHYICYMHTIHINIMSRMIGFWWKRIQIIKTTVHSIA